MKKLLFVLSVVALFVSCPGTLPEDTGEPEEQLPPEPIPIKLIAIGDDFTMGIQSAGLRGDFQLNSYPYLVAVQAGLAGIFEQPVVSIPGIGMLYVEPLGLDPGNQITTTTLLDDTPEEDLFAILIDRLSNAGLQRPYNNLGINGAKLLDLSTTTSSQNSDPADNFFFDIVLRNLVIPGVPNFQGKTVLDQVVLLDEKVPSDTTIIMVWIGINDIMGAVTTGGDIISPAVFETQYRAMLTSLSSIADNIVVANLPSYVPFFYVLDNIFVGGGEAMMFDMFAATDLGPMNFDDNGGVHYIPLLVDEPGATHLLLTAGLEYWQNGLGIPLQADLQADLDAAGISTPTAEEIVAGRSDVGTPITADQTLTDAEVYDLLAAIDACNDVISDPVIVAEFGLTLVDIHSIMSEGGTFGGYSEAYYLNAPSNTFFSLDGLHPNDLGYAVIANAFIGAINTLAIFDPALELLDTALYAGQYTPTG